MQFVDRVYGEVTVTEPVLLELMQSKPLERLKGINQAGAYQYVKKEKDVSRFEHSVGVMLLLQKLGASVEEQIAGLLHDVPHTAFSHVIDYVFRDDKQSFHEKFHEQVIMKSEVPSILEKHGFDVERIVDLSNFPLLERTLPDLCADRIDYAMRDRLAVDRENKNIAAYLQHFIVHDNEIIMADKNVAKRFAEEFMETDRQNWSHPVGVAIYQILADAIKVALKEGILTQDDLFEDDVFVYNKLKNSGNEEILEKLEMIGPKLEIIDDPENFHFHSKNKTRYIDPKFLEDGSIKRVSDAFPEFKEKIKKHKEWVGKGRYVRVVSY